jgi:UDP-GlcNAc3NAcA epimerase
MKLVTVVGARPQFIKAATVSRALLQTPVQEYLVHTGQHYDPEMSQIFFEELGLKPPYINLGIGSSGQLVQVGKIMLELNQVIQDVAPDALLVYGDTNSTLAGAIAACKTGVKLIHIEAGLRSFNRSMPEEHNRVLTDHCADLLFCPSQSSVDQLKREGITNGVHLVGDPMYDAVITFSSLAEKRSTILSDLSLGHKSFLLATVHRAYNTDQPENLEKILRAFSCLDEVVIFPVHPRTRKILDAMKMTIGENVHLIPPVGYLDMLILEQNARMILTDSGGVQKEALFFGVPCVTLRSETEWIETVQAGWNEITGTEPERIIWAVQQKQWPAGRPPHLFGDGHASERIAELIYASRLS